MENNLNKIKVLIIDDSIVARMIVKKTIKERGYNIIEAANGTEGLQLIKTGNPDIILTDYLMPDMNGLEMVEIVRKDGIMTPIIVISANQQDKTKEKFNELGVIGVVKKQSIETELLNYIDTAISLLGGK